MIYETCSLPKGAKGNYELPSGWLHDWEFAIKRCNDNDDDNCLHYVFQFSIFNLQFVESLCDAARHQLAFAYHLGDAAARGALAAVA